MFHCPPPGHAPKLLPAFFAIEPVGIRNTTTVTPPGPGRDPVDQPDSVQFSPALLITGGWAVMLPVEGIPR
jgi:hypothetical protein